MSDSVQTNTPSLQTPGDVDIQELYLITPRGNFISLDSYLVEFNIYEDIFSNTMSGDIAISDSRNLIKELPIMGDEYLLVKFRTPDFPENLIVNKTFKVVGITDRSVSPSIYILRFVSMEQLVDTLTPIFKSFSGKVSNIVNEIFDEYLKMNRTFVLNNQAIEWGKEKTRLLLLNETSNKIKFVSPGWGPFKCINWLASKSMPADGKACNYLFWETNKYFYFGSVEKIFKIGETDQNISIGEYHYTPAGVYKTTETNKKMFTIESLEVLSSSNTLDSYSQGHYGSRVISLDIINKSYDYIDYDHVKEFEKYTHVTGKDVFPIYSQPIRNLQTKTVVYTKHPDLHTGFKENANEKFPYIYGNRKSNLFELNNFRMKITIPGRTDITVGSLIDIVFPDVSPRDSSDSTKHMDKMFSGKYLITSMRHKVNPVRHYVILEIVKDALQKDNSVISPTVYSDVL